MRGVTDVIDKRFARPFGRYIGRDLYGDCVPMLAAGLYAPLAKIFLDRGYEVNIHSLPNFGLGRLDEASDKLAETVFGGDPNRRAILVGHSQGGVHAVDHAHRFPDQVRAVFCLWHSSARDADGKFR